MSQTRPNPEQGETPLSQFVGKVDEDLQKGEGRSKFLDQPVTVATEFDEHGRPIVYEAVPGSSIVHEQARALEGISAQIGISPKEYSRFSKWYLEDYRLNFGFTPYSGVKREGDQHKDVAYQDINGSFTKYRGTTEAMGLYLSSSLGASGEEENSRFVREQGTNINLIGSVDLTSDGDLNWHYLQLKGQADKDDSSDYRLVYDGEGSLIAVDLDAELMAVLKEVGFDDENTRDYSGEWVEGDYNGRFVDEALEVVKPMIADRLGIPVADLDRKLDLNATVRAFAQGQRYESEDRTIHMPEMHFSE